MPYVFFLTICAIWGSSFILMDRAAIAFPPLAVGLWRVVGGVIVLGVAASMWRQSLGLDRRLWGHVAVVASVANVWPFFLQPYLIGDGFGHGMMGMMVAFVPLMTIVASAPMLNVRPSGRQLLGVIGGLGCFTLLAIDTQQRGVSTVHFALALTVPAVYAFGNCYVKRYLRNLAPLPLTFWMLVVDAAFLFVISLVVDGKEMIGLPAATVPEWTFSIGALFALGVLATGFAMLLFNKLILDHGPLFAGMVTYIIPLGAVLLGRVDGEPVTKLQTVALLGALAMVALVQYGAAAPPQRQPDPLVRAAGSIEHE